MNNKDTDQTVIMCRLVCTFVVRTQQSLIFSRRDPYHIRASYIWASLRENLSSGFLTKRFSNQSAQLQRLARKLNLLVASSDAILSNKPITNALIGLHGCAGWSAPLSFANPRQVCSRHSLYNILISGSLTYTVKPV